MAHAVISPTRSHAPEHVRESGFEDEDEKASTGYLQGLWNRNPAEKTFVCDGKAFIESVGYALGEGVTSVVRVKAVVDASGFICARSDVKPWTTSSFLKKDGIDSPPGQEVRLLRKTLKEADIRRRIRPYDVEHVGGKL